MLLELYWLIFRVLKKLMTIFARVLVTFVKEQIFRGPYSVILKVLLPRLLDLFFIYFFF